MRFTLPVIEKITPGAISELIKAGFAYCRLPNPGVKEPLLSLHASGLEFFRRSNEYKQQWSVDEKFSGYVNRASGKDPQSIEQVFFRPEDPIEPFKKDMKTIHHVCDIFHRDISLRLLENIFLETGLHQHYSEACGQKTFLSFAFAYYPEQPPKNCAKGLSAHEDFDMITCLWPDPYQSGLEVFYNNSWQPVTPNPEYAVIFLGKTLRIITGEKTNAASHRVTFASKRLSMGLFVGPRDPVKDYTTGKERYETYSAYLKSQFDGHYEDLKLAKTLANNGIFSRKRQNENLPSLSSILKK